MSEPPAALIRAIALRHARGRDHEVFDLLDSLRIDTLSEMRVQLEFLAEAVTATQRRKKMSASTLGEH